VQGFGVRGRASNRYLLMGRVALAAADARRLFVRVMRRNFRKGMPASALRLIAGLV